MLSEKLGELVTPEIATSILATKRERVLLSCEPANSLGLVVSKAGGRGYLPKKMEYPKNEDGTPLTLLAQINFSEMPNLECFPKTGLLAFYHDYLDDLTGLDFDDQTKQNGFRVLYFETVDEPSYSVEEQDALFESVDEAGVPVVDGEFCLRGVLAEQVILKDSYDFEKAYGGSFYELLDDWTGEDERKIDSLYELDSSSSQLGGYPFFTQEDPRLGEEKAYHDTLLFQLDSDDNIMWGDMGVGNFFY